MDPVTLKALELAVQVYQTDQKIMESLNGVLSDSERKFAYEIQDTETYIMSLAKIFETYIRYGK